MEFRGIMGGFYRISEWIMRLSVTNVLWVVCSLPFFFLVLTLLVNPELSVDQLKQSIWLLAIVAPFTLMPATAAMFAVARKWVTGDEDAPLLKTFFRSYKENYLQAMIGGFLFLVLGVILFVNFRFYSGQAGALHWLSFLFITLFVILVAAFINFISIMVHFHMKLFQILKNSMLLTIGNPVGTVFTLVASGAILYVSFAKFTFLIPFFMGSLIAVVSFWQFYRTFQRVQDKQEKLEEAAAAVGESGEVAPEEETKS